MYRPQTDGEFLIQRAVGGDGKAFELLVSHFHDPLKQFIHTWRLRNAIASVGDDDILQETLLEVFNHIRTFEPRGSAAFLAWMKTIARNRMINTAKAQKARKRGGEPKQAVTPPSDATVTGILNLVASKNSTPSTIAGRKELVEIMGKALQNLKVNRREIMLLRYGKGLSVEETGALVGLSEGAVKMHINRALKELRNAFQRFSVSRL